MASHVPLDPVVAEILKQPSVAEWKRQTEVIINEEKANGIDPGVLDHEILKFTKYPKDTGLPSTTGPTTERPESSENRLPSRGSSYKIIFDDGSVVEPHAEEPEDGQEPMEDVLALMTQVYGRVESSYNAFYNVMEVEPNWPRLLNLQQAKQTFNWETEVPWGDGSYIKYPPHLKNIPDDEKSPVFAIFDKLGLLETQAIMRPFIPKTFWEKLAEPLYKWVLDQIKAKNGNIDGISKANSIHAFETFNRSNRKRATDISNGQNLGLLPDWYTDRRFAEQAFAGTNPTTLLRITKAEGNLLQEFTAAAKRHGYSEWYKRLDRDVKPDSLYVQDHRYFRKAFGAHPDEELEHQEKGSGHNRACAAVTLFELHENGILHPVAIVIDYKSTMEGSVTIFNKNILPSSKEQDESKDWPWRYAKTCAQVSDWIRHEVGVHLTRAHFIEEAIIVATRRTIRMDSIVYTILSPHWYKTLSLNAAARSVLVPGIIKDLVGLKKEYLERYMAYEYENFDYKQNYVPNDLKARGFPNDAAGLNDPKFKNYAYARNMIVLWDVIRRYVRSMLLTSYNEKTANESIAGDEDIQNWVKEVRTGAKIKSFPDIKTLDDLTDALTMSIHLAAPFHTAVNYLQNFYQAFVPAKPPALSSPLPNSVEILNGYYEDDLIQALPVNHERQWILAVQVPWLLSFKVASDRSLLTFASSQATNFGGKNSKQVRAISNELFENLKKLGEKFIKHSHEMTEGSIPYQVMDPATTAVSILI
ncbi:putative linoleate 9S-lipoxygenase 4-like protein [Cladobotryum mycophilum]|uniref:Manganese lipoxygenase n=1 Tax=Cladobotryum mycophilum TaxID=491253 RepID=A0ABR0SAQ4_9HYPO